jgi:tRNA(Ile)-lysidine synthase
VTLEAEHILPGLEPWRGAPRWWLGLSGGLDSRVLLDMLAVLREHHELPPLTAIHVDHQLHPRSAAWAEECADICRLLDVPLEYRQVSVEEAGAGPEAAAREARYRVFESLLGENDLLLLAHHLDDQVETFFLRLMRGAGPRGLAGMPATRPLGAGALLRPLLPYSRADLERYARDRGIAWVEDSSNLDTAMDRNFLRHRVLPLLAERWPGYRESVQRSIDALADAEQLLGELDRERLAAARGESFGAPLLCLDTLAPASAQELARLLRRWIEAEALEVPPQARLLEFARQLRSAQPDSQPRLDCAGCSLRRYRDRVYLCAEPPPALPEAVDIAPGQPVCLPGLGRLEMAPAREGLRLPAAGCWQLRFRSGGERCRPAGRGRSKSLKKLLQEQQVPPWVRERLPLLYDAGDLAGVADICVCEGFEAAPGEPAFRLLWTRNAPPVD